MSQRVAVFSGSKEVEDLAKIVAKPIPEIDDDEVLIKAVAYAVNPTDWKHFSGDFGEGQPGYHVGSDVSGIVAKVGSKVKNLSEGDYVGATLHGNQNFRTGCFADYVPAKPAAILKFDKSSFKDTALTPGNVPHGKIDTFEAAAAIPLSFGTAAVSLANSLHVSPNKSENADKYILIWGGATAAGILAIQLAKLVYGLKVIAVASSKHNSFLKGLGADELVDYKDGDVVEKIKSIGKGRINYALDAVSTPETLQQVYDATEGTDEVCIDNLLFLEESNIKTKESRKVRFGKTIVYSLVEDDIAMDAFTMKTSDEFKRDLSHFWNNLLPPIVSQLKSPNLKVLQKGLESTNEALALLKYDKVSGQKVVFRN